jgi:hypothetical protein
MVRSVSFNYDDDTIAAADVVSGIAAQMSDTPAKPLSDAERAALDNFIAASRERDRQQRLEYEQRRAELAAAERAERERQAAIARAERTEKLKAEMAERDRRQSRDRTLTGLLNASIEQRQYRQGFAKSAQMAASRQRLSKALDNMIATKYPPPPSEPSIVVVEQDDGSADWGSPNFDVAKWSKKPRSWW